MKKLTAIFILLILAVLVGNRNLYSVDCFKTNSENCMERPGYALPQSVEEFLGLREKIGKDPWGGATLFIYGLMVRTYDESLGKKFLVLSTAEDSLRKVNGEGDYKGYSLGDSFLYGQADKVPHCIRSYAANTSVDNDYQLDKKNVPIRFRNQEKYVGSQEEGSYKVFVCSTGTDSCRPVSLKKNSKGFWKVSEFSSLVVGCRVPQSKAIKQAEEDL